MTDPPPKDQKMGNEEEYFPDARDPRIQNIRNTGGKSLEPALRTKLEQAFKHSFDHVRIHTSGADAESAQALNAHAFTSGSHIYFDAGQFNPGTHAGMELLAHELTHVVQFDQGRIRSQSSEMEVSKPTDAVEVEAVRKGAEIARSVGPFHSSPLPFRRWGSCPPPPPAPASCRSSRPCGARRRSRAARRWRT